MLCRGRLTQPLSQYYGLTFMLGSSNRYDAPQDEKLILEPEMARAGYGSILLRLSRIPMTLTKEVCLDHSSTNHILRDGLDVSPLVLNGSGEVNMARAAGSRIVESLLSQQTLGQDDMRSDRFPRPSLQGPGA
jgi:hypothetical protein